MINTLTSGLYVISNLINTNIIQYANTETAFSTSEVYAKWFKVLLNIEIHIVGSTITLHIYCYDKLRVFCIGDSLGVLGLTVWLGKKYFL